MHTIIRNAKDLGAALRNTRKQQGLRQVDVAEKANLRQALLSDLETGATSARLDTLMKVVAALGLDLSITPRRTDGFDPTEY